MRKPTFCICENKGADQLRSNCKADQHLCFRYTDSTMPVLFQPLAIFCACTARCVSDLFSNHIVGFLMMRLIWRTLLAGMFKNCIVWKKTIINESLHMKTFTKHLGFRAGLTQTTRYSHRKRLEVRNFQFKKRDCTICVAKTKTLISCAVTAQLICIFVFA